MSLLNRLFPRAPKPDAPQPGAMAPIFAPPPLPPPAPPEPAAQTAPPPPAPVPPPVREIRVSIEPDVSAHIDAALRIIGQSGALNFSQSRVGRNDARTAAQLRHMLTRRTIQAGLVRVQDGVQDGGQDGGFCGLFVLRDSGQDRRLLHFCFTDAIAGLGVEHWLYRKLGRPALEGGAAPDDADAGHDTMLMDGRNPARQFDTVYVRGGEGVRAVAQYFAWLAREVHADAGDTAHSSIARYALAGIDPAAVDAFGNAGLGQADFTTQIAALPRSGRDVWLLDFAADATLRVWRHRSTNAVVPAAAETEAAAEGRRRTLKRDFESLNGIDEAAFGENLRVLLDAAPAETPVFVLLLHDERKLPDAHGHTVIEKSRRVNDWTRAVAAAYPRVVLLRPTDFVASADEIGGANGFDRMVYVRIFRAILQQLPAGHGPGRDGRM